MARRAHCREVRDNALGEGVGFEEENALHLIGHRGNFHSQGSPVEGVTPFETLLLHLVTRMEFPVLSIGIGRVSPLRSRHTLIVRIRVKMKRSAKLLQVRDALGFRSSLAEQFGQKQKHHHRKRNEQCHQEKRVEAVDVRINFLHPRRTASSGHVTMTGYLHRWVHRQQNGAIQNGLPRPLLIEEA